MSEHIEVTGSGAATAQPDAVAVDVRVQCEGADVATALRAAADRVAAALRASTDHGLAERDRATTGVTVTTRWDREGQGVVGYTASHGLRLVVRDTDLVGDLLDALAGAVGDALGVDGVRLEVSDPAPLHVRAREAAFVDATSRAEQLAELAGRPLGPVLRVTEVSRDGGGHIPRLRAMAASDSSGMPVAAGESTVTAEVVVRYGLG